jgi:hypothetical protein
LDVHRFPSFILVGIGYPGKGQFAGLSLRTRDFTHADYPKSDRHGDKLNWPIEGVEVVEEGTKDAGGAEDFQRFIGEELIPFVDQSYPTIPGDRTYFGHSGGGFFGLYTMLTQTQLFRNYIVSSPGLSYSGELPGGYQYQNYEFGLHVVRDFLASGRSLEGIKLYLSVGTEEDFQPLYFGEPPTLGGPETNAFLYSGHFQLTASVFRLASILKNAAIPGLKLMVESFPGEIHMSVYPIAFIHGVQAVFDMRRIGGVY